MPPWRVIRTEKRRTLIIVENNKLFIPTCDGSLSVSETSLHAFHWKYLENLTKIFQKLSYLGLVGKYSMTVPEHFRQPIVRTGSDYWLVVTVLSPPPSLPLRLRKYPGATHQRREKRKNFGNFLQRNNRNNKRNNKISSIVRMSEATATAPYLFFYLFLSLFHLHHHIFIWFHKSLTENENKLNSLSSSLKERKKPSLKPLLKR